jgi:hypothetical protein
VFFSPLSLVARRYVRLSDYRLLTYNSPGLHYLLFGQKVCEKWIWVDGP